MVSTVATVTSDSGLSCAVKSDASLNNCEEGEFGVGPSTEVSDGPADGG